MYNNGISREKRGNTTGGKHVTQWEWGVQNQGFVIAGGEWERRKSWEEKEKKPRDHHDSSCSMKLWLGLCSLLPEPVT